MINKELLETYAYSIEEELEMMKEKPVSNSMLDYLDKLMCTYKKIKKLVKHDEKQEHGYSEDKIKDTMVDERLENAVDEYGSYMAYKDTYKKSKLQSDLDMAHQELGHYLQNLVDMFVEVEKCSKDIPEERSMIKAKIKEIYQMFN